MLFSTVKPILEVTKANFDKPYSIKLYENGFLIILHEGQTFTYKYNSEKKCWTEYSLT